eukprot:5666143-Amphidinium_carterae.1
MQLPTNCKGRSLAPMQCCGVSWALHLVCNASASGNYSRCAQKREASPYTTEKNGKAARKFVVVFCFGLPVVVDGGAVKALPQRPAFSGHSQFKFQGSNTCSCIMVNYDYAALGDVEALRRWLHQAGGFIDRRLVAAMCIQPFMSGVEVCPVILSKTMRLSRSFQAKDEAL